MPTRAGWFVLVSPVLFGVAAVSTDNTLLFFIMGALLSAIVVSGLGSEANLRGVSVSMSAAPEVYAGTSSRLLFRFQREDIEHHAAPAFALVLRRRRGLFQSRSKKDLEVQLAVLDGREGWSSWDARFEKRGRWQVPRTELCTRYPFGLITKSRDVELDGEVVVRPRKVELPYVLMFPGVPGMGEGADRMGDGGDIFGLRERLPWDEATRVHALRSLSLNKEILMERSQEEQREAVIGVYNGLGAEPEAFERVLEYAAAALGAWTHAGFCVGLRTAVDSMVHTTTDRTALLDRLSTLTLVDPGESPRLDRGSVWLVPTPLAPALTGRVFFVRGDGSISERGDK
jgi:hypothetical protein